MKIRPALALAAALSLTLAACGDDTDGQSTPSPAATDAATPEDEAEDTGTAEADAATGTDTDAETGDAAAGTTSPEDQLAGAGEFPVTVDTPNGEVTIEQQPQRIVSLSPSATEILFAIGAGDQVVAADAYSTYPEEAPTTDLSGFDPNVEAIVGYEPDLVVISNDSNDLVASLEALDIPAIVNPAPLTVEEGWDGMAGLGLATGQVDTTAEAIADLRQQVQDAFADAPESESLRVYHELDETFYSASSNSFIGDVYTQLGAVNIADEADTDQTGYPQLTEEAIIAADPQLIVITDQVSYTAEDLMNRPGWSEIEAVQNGDVVVVDADIASRWGPRLPQMVQQLSDALSEMAVPAGN